MMRCFTALAAAVLLCASTGAAPARADPLRQSPRDAAWNYSRGLTYWTKGDYERAIASYDEAIRINPGFAAAYYNRGVAYSSRGDYDRAIADYNEATRLEPGFVAAYLNRGSAYERRNDRAKAVADYSKVLALPADSQQDRDYQAYARRQLARLGAAPAPAPTGSGSSSSSPGCQKYPELC